MITTVDGLRYGQMVLSIAGRDTGHYYLITGFIEEKFIKAVDGQKYPIGHTKKKNLKHVKVTMLVEKKIEELLNKGGLPSNAEVVAAIKRMKNQLEEGERFHG